MPLIKTVLLPHSPLLIPEIGRTNHHFLAKTTAAYERLGAELKEAGVETIVIISPHGRLAADSFTINIAPEMIFDFKDFGLIMPLNFLPGDALLADQIKNTARQNFPLRLISENPLDHGSAVPLYLLKTLIGDFKTLIISPPMASGREQLLAFGSKIRSVIEANPKKIALIASGDLSHRLQKKSPGGYSPKGAKFDNKLIEYLSDPEDAVAEILKMDKKLVKDAGECGFKSILIMLGVLSGRSWESEVLAYQTDFGVGYLSMDFKLT
jgi:AmmeMemoRadiSam system protein B